MPIRVTPGADNFYDALHGIEWEKYYYIECLVCHGVFRLGMYGFEEGATNCVYCGAMSWCPNLVDKQTYLKFLERRKNPKGMEAFQKNVWSMNTGDGKGTDEIFQRR
jgi:hypothetical protein